MIELRDLTRSYGERVALQPTTLAIQPGEICGLLGANGAGKSTTLKLLAGLIQPTAGAASIAGHDVVTAPLQAKAALGYVPESPAVYAALTAIEYLDLVGDLHELDSAMLDERRDQFIARFALAELAHQPLATLSKGNRQKVVIAAALLHDPQVLLFDEVLDGLDTHMARAVKDLLRTLAARNRTILFSSHVMEVVERMCDRVVILHEGRVVLDARTSELLTARGANASLESIFESLTARGDAIELAAALACT